jgi:hypothetical protein
LRKQNCSRAARHSRANDERVVVRSHRATRCATNE